ncbi:Vault protein inter-alpha-trypsin domain [Pelomyxa schiedti]|nr:Vault protein inter-alpha-trypsin domain [Pelomyxa schiedti]
MGDQPPATQGSRTSSSDVEEARVQEAVGVIRKKLAGASSRSCGSRAEGLVLRGVSVTASVVSCCAEICILNEYVNERDSPVEAIFEFPLPVEMAICGFTASVNGKEITAQIKEKETAFGVYDDALASGHGAFLAEVTNTKTTTEFKISVGNLPPHQSAKCKLQCVLQLETLKDETLFYIPKSVFPGTVPVEIEATFSSPQGIVNISCPTHRPLLISDASSGLKKLHWSSPTGILGNDFICVVFHEKPHIPTAVVETTPDKSSCAAMVTFYPEWSNLNSDFLDPMTEIIFLLDRSGSMSGCSGGRSAISLLAETMLMLLHSLPYGCLFNIIGFGSSYERLFQQSITYNDESLSQSISHVSGLRANLGGTDLHSPLSFIFNLPEDINFPRQIFLLTDGDVERKEQLGSLVRHNSKCSRVFTFGIGGSVNRALIEEIAFAGRGHHVMIPDLSTMKHKVMEQLQRALEPTLKNLHVKWPFSVRQAPSRLRPVFNGERLTVYGLLNDSVVSREPVDLILECIDPNGKAAKFTVPINSEARTSGVLLHRLAARELIRELEDDPLAEKRHSVELSLKWNVVCNGTAFVAVEHRPGEAISESLTPCRVNVQSSVQHSSPTTPTPAKIPPPSIPSTPQPSPPSSTTSRSAFSCFMNCVSRGTSDIGNSYQDDPNSYRSPITCIRPYSYSADGKTVLSFTTSSLDGSITYWGASPSPFPPSNSMPRITQEPNPGPPSQSPACYTGISAEDVKTLKDALLESTHKESLQHSNEPLCTNSNAALIPDTAPPNPPRQEPAENLIQSMCSSPAFLAGQSITQTPLIAQPQASALFRSRAQEQSQIPTPASKPTPAVNSTLAPPSITQPNTPAVPQTLDQLMHHTAMNQRANGSWDIATALLVLSWGKSSTKTVKAPITATANDFITPAMPGFVADMVKNLANTNRPGESAPGVKNIGAAWITAVVVAWITTCPGDLSWKDLMKLILQKSRRFVAKILTECGATDQQVMLFHTHACEFVSNLDT